MTFDLSLFYSSTQSNWPLFPLKNQFVSIPLISRNKDQKVSLIFIKMYYLTDFKHFESIFYLIFNPIDPLFIYFRSFWLLIWQNLISDWVFFFLMLNPATEHLVKYPLHPQYLGDLIFIFHHKIEFYDDTCIQNHLWQNWLKTTIIFTFWWFTSLSLALNNMYIIATTNINMKM